MIAPAIIHGKTVRNSARFNVEMSIYLYATANFFTVSIMIQIGLKSQDPDLIYLFYIHVFTFLHKVCTQFFKFYDSS